MTNKIYTLLPHDKCLHIIVSAVIAIALRHLFSLPCAIALTLAIGIAKEIYDQQSNKGTADWKDLLADCMGIIIGIL